MAAGKLALLMVIGCTLGLRGASFGQATSAEKVTPGELAQALRDVRQQYGEDTVTLQTLLFTNTLRSGSIMTVEVGVDGVDGFAGRSFLGLHVQTGIIFNTNTHDLEDRLRKLWSSIVAPSLARLRSFNVPADGVKIDISYSHRPYRSESELRDTIEDTGVGEHMALYLFSQDVLRLLQGELSEQELLDRSHLIVNGSSRHLELDPARGPVPGSH